MFKTITKRNKAGFVLLFAVTLTAIILSIALGIAEVAQEEVKFSSSAKDTGAAFYAADTGYECVALYDKSSSNSFPVSGTTTNISCAGQTITPTYTAKATDGSGNTTIGEYDFVLPSLNAGSCASVQVIKDGSTAGQLKTTITSKGYNLGDSSCYSGSSSRVERNLQVSYSQGTSSTSIIPPPSLVQQKAANVGGGTFATVTITQPTAGDALILLYNGMGSTSPSDASLTSVSGGGVTWVKAASSATNAASEIWYGLNSSGVGTSVTVGYNGTTLSAAYVNISEWSGLPSSGSVLDGTGSTNGVSTTAATSNITTTHATDLIMATSMNTCASFISGPTNSFTNLSNLAGMIYGVAYKVVNSTQAYSTSWGLSSSCGWDAAIAAFKGR